MSKTAHIAPIKKGDSSRRCVCQSRAIASIRKATPKGCDETPIINTGFEGTHAFVILRYPQIHLSVEARHWQKRVLARDFIKFEEYPNQLRCGQIFNELSYYKITESPPFLQIFPTKKSHLFFPCSLLWQVLKTQVFHQRSTDMMEYVLFSRKNITTLRFFGNIIICNFT